MSGLLQWLFGGFCLYGLYVWHRAQRPAAVRTSAREETAGAAA